MKNFRISFVFYSLVIIILNKVILDRFAEDTFYNVEPGGPGGGYDNRQMFVNSLTSDQFPALGGNASNANNITLVSKNYTKFSSAAFNSNDFPSLGTPIISSYCK